MHGVIRFVYLQLVNRNNMVKFIVGPAGGFPNSRTMGTKVTLAGRTAILPNDNVPFVVQRLTVAVSVPFGVTS